MTGDLQRQLLDALDSPDESVPADELRRLLTAGIDVEPYFPVLIRALAVPSADVRYLAAEVLKQAVVRYGKNIEPALPGLQALFTDNRQVSWLAGTSIGWVREAALDTVALHFVQRERWQEVEAMVAQESARAYQVVSCLRGAARSRGLSGMETILARARSSDDPDLRGAAAGAYVCAYAPAGRWHDVEELIESADYATRWYALSALDDLAEDLLDLTPLIPALLGVFAHDNATLEKDHNVRYTATLRTRAANVLIWILMAKKRLPRKKKPAVLDGVNLEEIPEIQLALKELRSLARAAGRDL